MPVANPTTTEVPGLPGYVAGRWSVDPLHSSVSFTVRHLMVSKVRGHFTTFDADIVTAPDPLQSSVSATVDLSSIDTGNADRDAHIRSADFFDVDAHPTLTFRSTGIRRDGDGFAVDGELTIHGVTRPVTLALEVNGFQHASPFGDVRAGFSATTEINRKDYGISLDMPLEGGGVVVGDRVQIALEIEAILRQD
ncbi:MAG TPA: YceI family protein [Acidimicrobiia bacterium]|nr:YceI family protein [Acidimicrobiia bacterium]